MPDPSSPAPLILTAAFAGPDQDRFDRLRRLHFPAHLNHIAAHLTLFHHLPGDEQDMVGTALRQLAEQQGAPCRCGVTGVRSLGRGVAFTLDCEPLARLRGTLARHLHDRLTAQDRQGWRPHVTIQNKVMPAEAADLLAQMRAGFAPFSVEVTGLSLWRYLGGPWEPVSYHPFTQAGPAPA